MFGILITFLEYYSHLLGFVIASVFNKCGIIEANKWDIFYQNFRFFIEIDDAFIEFTIHRIKA
jgi:hypothetical protein